MDSYGTTFPCGKTKLFIVNLRFPLRNQWIPMKMLAFCEKIHELPELSQKNAPHEKRMAATSHFNKLSPRCRLPSMLILQGLNQERGKGGRPGGLPPLRAPPNRVASLQKWSRFAPLVESLRSQILNLYAKYLVFLMED